MASLCRTVVCAAGGASIGVAQNGGTMANAAGGANIVAVSVDRAEGDNMLVVISDTGAECIAVVPIVMGGHGEGGGSAKAHNEHQSEEKRDCLFHGLDLDQIN